MEKRTLAPDEKARVVIPVIPSLRVSLWFGNRRIFVDDGSPPPKKVRIYVGYILPLVFGGSAGLVILLAYCIVSHPRLAGYYGLLLVAVALLIHRCFNLMYDWAVRLVSGYRDIWLTAVEKWQETWRDRRRVIQTLQEVEDIDTREAALQEINERLKREKERIEKMAQLDIDIEFTSLIRRRKLFQEHALLIDERKAEYVMSTDVPLDLVKEKRRLERELAEIDRRIERIIQSAARGKSE